METNDFFEDRMT